MASVLLQVEELTLTSLGGNIIERVSFTFERGEIVALTGKSGSGKTSIGLAILGILPAGIKIKEGSIKWFGDQNSGLTYPSDAALWSNLRGLQIGYIQQDVFGIFDPVLRMGHQMSLILKELTSLTSSEIESELRIKMAEVGITEIDRIWRSYPHQLSGGQLQRCQICLSIVLQPALLIADEPTSAIDKINQVDLLDLLAHVRDQYQMAILCITHEEAVVQYLADRRIDLEESSRTVKLEREDAAIPFEPLGKPLLEVTNLGFTHKFGGIMNRGGAKIHNIDFTLKAGQCLGILGESGSGKSTIAQLMVGLLTPETGQVKWNGRKLDFDDRTDLRFLRSKIQLVMQDGRGSLHPNLSIRELMQEVVDNHKGLKDSIEIDLTKVLNEVGLSSEILDRREGSLSGGECLRVSIARALLVRPDLLICDESTTSLDIPSRDGIIDLLRSLQKSKQLALILISHDDGIIRILAHDIIVLSDGAIVEGGKIEEVITQPQHAVTKKIFSAQATLSEKRNH